MATILRRSRMRGRNNAKSKLETLKSMALKLLKQGSIEQVGYLTDLSYDDLKIMKRKIVDGLL